VSPEAKAPATAADVVYLTDARASQFTVQVFAGGLLSSFGHSPTISIRGFAGEARANPEDLHNASLKLIIQAESLAVRDDISDKDRNEIERTMKQDVLEVSSYPEIVYDCSDIVAAKSGAGQYSATLNGELTLHGTSRPQPVTARVTLTEDSLRAFGNFSILQSDYDLKPVKVAGGALKVKDELKFSFNILARKKD